MTKEQVAEIRTYKIYRHMLPNGEVYIGTTSMEKLYERFDYGNGYKNQPFGKVIFEYGWKQVVTDILEEVIGTYKDATLVESYWVKKHLDEGYEVYNKHYTTKDKEYKNNIAGCTVLTTNTYYPTISEAAAAIGVTPSAISIALKEDRPCKGFHLAYGDKTNEENDEETEA